MDNAAEIKLSWKRRRILVSSYAAAKARVHMRVAEMACCAMTVIRDCRCVGAILAGAVLPAPYNFMPAECFARTMQVQHSSGPYLPSSAQAEQPITSKPCSMQQFKEEVASHV